MPLTLYMDCRKLLSCYLPYLADAQLSRFNSLWGKLGSFSALIFHIWASSPCKKNTYNTGEQQRFIHAVSPKPLLYPLAVHEMRWNFWQSIWSAFLHIQKDQGSLNTKAFKFISCCIAHFMSRNCPVQKLLSPETVKSRNCPVQKLLSPETVLSRNC